MPKHTFDISPYKNIVIFVVTLIAADCLWKIMIHGDEAGDQGIWWLGMEVSSFFNTIAEHIARSVYRIVHMMNDDIHLLNGTILRYSNGNSTRVVWACTPVKQIFIYSCLLLTAAPYKTWHKLWYILIGWGVVYAINILRISIITIIIAKHPEWFEIMHGYVLKYAFYGIIFLMWLLWTEVIATRIEKKNN